MSPAQDKRYWRLWGAVARAAKAAGAEPPERKALHRRALEGCARGAGGGPCPQCAARLADESPISHKEFGNHWTDLIFAVFLAEAEPGDLRAQMRQEDQPLIRLRYRISALAKGNEGVLERLLQDRFKWPVWVRHQYPDEAGVRLELAPAVIVAEYRESAGRVAVEDLNEGELTQLRDTLERVTRERKAKRVAMVEIPASEGGPF